MASLRIMLLIFLPENLDSFGSAPQLNINLAISTSSYSIASCRGLWHISDTNIALTNLKHPRDVGKEQHKVLHVHS